VGQTIAFMVCPFSLKHGYLTALGPLHLLQ
jgi:hypothetical protein